MAAMSVMQTIERIVSFGPRWPGRATATARRSNTSPASSARWVVRRRWSGSRCGPRTRSRRPARGARGGRQRVSVSSPPLGVVILAACLDRDLRGSHGTPLPCPLAHVPARHRQRQLARQPAGGAQPDRADGAPRRRAWRAPLLRQAPPAPEALLCYRDSRAASTSSSGLRSRHWRRRWYGSSAAGTRTRCRRSSSCPPWPWSCSPHC